MTTQAQIDQLKAWHAQGKPLIDALTPDTGPAAPVFTQFSAAYLGNLTYYRCNVDASGNPTSPSVFSHIVDQSTPSYGRIIWGASGEHHELISVGAEQWGIVQAFENMSNGAVYGLETVKADWGPLGGPYKDINYVCPSGAPNGTPECPQVLPASGMYRIRIWLWTYNSLVDSHLPPARQNPGYAEQLFTFGTQVSNPAWQGGGATTRLGLKFSEVWWDPGGGWLRGTCPRLPWVQSGTTWTVQDPGNPTYQGYEVMGLGTGIMWRYDVAGYATALTKAQ